MSKGLGKVEQQLLHEIEINPQERTVVALFNMDATEAEARRRAARSLDRKGLAVLRKTGRKGKFRSKSLLRTQACAFDQLGGRGDRRDRIAFHGAHRPAEQHADHGHRHQA